MAEDTHDDDAALGGAEGDPRAGWGPPSAFFPAGAGAAPALPRRQLPGGVGGAGAGAGGGTPAGASATPPPGGGPAPPPPPKPHGWGGGAGRPHRFPRSRGVLWDRTAAGEPVRVHPLALAPRVELAGEAARALLAEPAAGAGAFRARCLRQAGKLRLRVEAPLAAGEAAAPGAAGAVVEDRFGLRIRRAPAPEAEAGEAGEGGGGAGDGAEAEDGGPADLPGALGAALASPGPFGLHQVLGLDCRCAAAGGGTLRVWGSLRLPAAPLRLKPLYPLLVCDTGLARSLRHTLGRSGIPDGAARTGYLTMDQGRKLLPLLDSEPRALQVPLVGFWVACGPAGVRDPLVWAAAVRFMHHPRLQDRALQGRSCLLLLFAARTGSPQCFEAAFEDADEAYGRGRPAAVDYGFAGTLLPPAAGATAVSFELVPKAGGRVGRAGALEEGEDAGFRPASPVDTTPAPRPSSPVPLAQAPPPPAAPRPEAAGPLPSAPTRHRYGVPPLEADVPPGGFFWDPAGARAPGAPEDATEMLEAQRQVQAQQQEQIVSLQKQIQDLQRRLSDQARVKDAGPDLNATAIPATAEALAARRYHGVEPDYDEETLPDDMDISLRGRANVSYASSAGTASVRSSLNASIDPQTVQGLKEALDHAVERAANAAEVAISRKQGRDAKAEVAHALESIGTAMEASSHSLHPLYADLPSSSSDDSFVDDDELVPQWLSAPAAEAAPQMDGEIPRIRYEPLSDSESENEEEEKLIAKYLGASAAQIAAE